MENSLVVYNEFKVLAAELVKSALCPKSFKSPQDAWYAILKGRELGLSPIYSLDNIAVINGKTTLSADAMLAIAKANPEYGGCDVNDTNESCTVTMKRNYRNGVVDTRTVTFTMADAKAAGLTDREGKMYQKYPKRMLRARATSYACGDLFSDILGGIYSAEEMRAITPAPTGQEIGYTDTEPDSSPSEVDMAKLLKECYDALNSIALVSTKRDEYKMLIDSSYKARNAAGLRETLAILVDTKEKMEVKAQESRTPTPPVDETPVAEEAQIIEEEPPLPDEPGTSPSTEPKAETKSGDSTIFDAVAQIYNLVGEEQKADPLFQRTFACLDNNDEHMAKQGLSELRTKYMATDKQIKAIHAMLNEQGKELKDVAAVESTLQLTKKAASDVFTALKAGE